MKASIFASGLLILGLSACTASVEKDGKTDPNATPAAKGDATAKGNAAAKAASQPSAKVAAKPTSKPTSKPTVKPANAAVQSVDVNAKDAKALLDAGGVTVLDIRTPKEFAAGHIEGAINIDFRAKDFEDQLSKLDKSKHYLMHCRSGGRSGSAMPIFEKLKFQRISHLIVGSAGWEKAGFPLKK